MSNEQWAMSNNLFCSSLTAHCSLVGTENGTWPWSSPCFPVSELQSRLVFSVCGWSQSPAQRVP